MFRHPLDSITRSVHDTLYDVISRLSAYEFEQVSNFSHDAFLLIAVFVYCFFGLAYYIQAIRRMAGVFGYALQYSDRAQSR